MRLYLPISLWYFSTKDESIHGDKVNYGDEFFLKAENYGDPDVSINNLSFLGLLWTFVQKSMFESRTDNNDRVFNVL